MGDGPNQEVHSPQLHYPADLAASDFTDMSSLGVTIGGRTFPHLLYHFVLTYSNWETASICFAESFESLAEGFQKAVWRLGGYRFHRPTTGTAQGIIYLAEAIDTSTEILQLAYHTRIHATGGSTDISLVGEQSLLNEIHLETTNTHSVMVNPSYSEIAGCFLFYNDSTWDGAGMSDDSAIATEKQPPLLPGETASLANYTSFSRGINGLMIEVDQLSILAEATTDGRFPVPDGQHQRSGIVATGVGADRDRGASRQGNRRGGSDRSRLGRWRYFQYVAPGDDFGRFGYQPRNRHFFFFGNMIGEVGDTFSPVMVTAAGLVAICNHPRGTTNPASIDNRYDTNKDTLVDATDLILARNNIGSPMDALRMITPPPLSPTPAPLSAAEGEASDRPMVPLDWLPS